MPFEEAANLPALGTTADLDRHPAVSVVKAAPEILEIEAPIPEARLVSLVAQRFGISRLYSKRIETIRACFDLIPGIQKTNDDTGSYLWSSERSPTTWNNYRMTPEGHPRDLWPTKKGTFPIAREEIRNAMVDIVRIAHGAYSEELIRRTAQLFGRQVLSDDVEKRLRSVLDWASSEAVGSLLLDGEHYQIPLPDES